jgi:hypothetical protein
MNDVYRQELASHPWIFHCAEKRELASTDDPAAYHPEDWDWRYPLPVADPDYPFLRMIRIIGVDDADATSPYCTNGTPAEEYPFEVRGDYLYCDEVTPTILYVYDTIPTETGAESLPPWFVMALSFKCASLIALRMTGSPAMAQAFDMRYRGAIAEAKKQDALRSRPVPKVVRPQIANSRW